MADLPKQSRKGDFHLVEFSLTDTARNHLQRELDAYLDDPKWHISTEALAQLEEPDRAALQARRLEHLKGIVERHFPDDILARVRDNTDMGEIHPVIIHNLPKDKQEQFAKFTDRPGLKGLWRGKRERSYSEAIANGLYAAMEMEPTINAFLVRTVSSHHSNVTESTIHNDLGKVGIFSAGQNEERAQTRFIDIHAILDQLTPAQYAGLGLETKRGEKLDGRLKREFSDDMQINTEKSDPQALQAFKALAEDHSIDVMIDPGCMVVFNNRRILHQARKGTIEHLPQQAQENAQHATRVLSSHFGDSALSMGA